MTTPEEQQPELSTDPIKELAELSRLHFEKEKLIESLQAENEELKKQNQRLDSKRLHSGEKNKKLHEQNQQQAEEIERLKAVFKNIYSNIKNHKTGGATQQHFQLDVIKSLLGGLLDE